MISKEEMKSGKVEFDIIMNGEVVKRVSGGLLAYYDEEEDGLAVMTQGVRPDFMAKVAASLIVWLMKHNHFDLLIRTMDECIGE